MKRLTFSTSILRSNKLFSGALILIYTLTMALLVMMCFFSKSIDATFQEFLDAYGLPDAYIVTSGSPDMLTETMEDTDGVEAVCAGAIMDAKTELPSGNLMSLRYIGINETELLGLYNVDTEQRVYVNESTVAVYSGNHIRGAE